MRRLFIALCVLFLLFTSAIGQPAKPPPTEEREAKALAAAFFNRYQKTRDVAPLIRDFFIKDFARRAKFCGTTGKCGGRGKDFWQEHEVLTKLNASEEDFETLYSNGANYFFLYSQIFRFFQLSSGAPSDQIENLAEKFISDKLNRALKNQSEILKFSDLDRPSPKLETLDQFRKYLHDYRLFLTVLRSIVTTLRLQVKKSKPKISTLFSPKDFDVWVNDESTPFFDYPIGTRFIEVWAKPDKSGLLRVDLIRISGRLKIVAVYMPID